MTAKARPVKSKEFRDDIATGKWTVRLRRNQGTIKEFIVTIDNNYIPEADRWTKPDFLKGLAPGQLRFYVLENNASGVDGAKWRDVRYTNIIDYERVEGS